ncbi:MAG TPA: protein kinase, partial [Pyrinomonadaceae bacterium]|nr:protein kinase [Pyrinomonadaceae bacterium]
AFLRQACGEDDSLCREVESLLDAEEEAADFLAAGAIDDAAKALAQDQSFSPVGKQLGHYQVRSLLGAGGMGEVYLAQDTKLDRAVALKILSAEFAADKNRMRRFEQEARSAAALNHSHIAHIYEIGEAEGKHYISMEYIEGDTLRNEIYLEKTSLPKLLKYLAQVAGGLAKAHEKGIVHRDLKPDNIMITRDGDAKILDFGLSKLIEPPKQTGSEGVRSEVATARMSQHSTPGMVMGTVGYMSPEQAQGKVREIDHRSDIFSFGCILFEAATRLRAFEGKDVLDSLHKIVYAPIPQIKDTNAAAPAELQRIVRRCLAKEPEKRYQSIKDVGIELEELRQELKDLAEFEQTVQPAVGGRPVSPEAPAKTEGAYPSAIGTAEIGASRTTSSAEYVVSGISRHKRAALAALLVVAGIAAASWYYFHSQNSQTTIHSIAVLPFTNVSKDADMEYLSDGISESLINSLSKLPDVKVIARSSAFSYKGKEADIADVAKALGVEAVLTGRVTQRGDNLSISVELVNARDKTQLWGEQYDRKMSDLLAIQREIASEIVENLKLKVSVDKEGFAKPYTENNEAYQLYLKGRFHWDKRTPEAVKKSIEYFNQAIEKDPTFALAYVGLADSYVVPAIRIPPREAMPKAKAAAMRALELDETLAEAHASLARVLASYDWDWTNAEKEYKRAIELNPRYPVAHQWYGGYLAVMGRTNEALAERKRAQELDPLSLIINSELGMAFYYARDYDQAIGQFEKTLELDQNFPPGRAFLLAAYEQKGMYNEAIAEFKKALPLRGISEVGFLRAGLGHVYAVTGKKSEARKVLAELKQLSEQGYVPAPSIALIHAGLGEKDQAFAWLEKGYEQRAFQMQWLKIEPRWDSLRSDPRFGDLIRRIGLPE